MLQKEVIESKTGGDDNEALNGLISEDEIQRTVEKLKLNKATGVDKIPKEIFKRARVCEMLHELLSCFEARMAPSLWLRGVIVPIPKGADKDPCVPQNYRGITLLPCVDKVYSSVLNNRLVNYFDLVDAFSDEQNRFRSKRSCLNHVLLILFQLSLEIDYRRESLHMR